MRWPRVTRSPSRTDTSSSRPAARGATDTVVSPIKLPTTVSSDAMLARLAVGDRKGAQSAFQGLLRASTRDPTDLRTRLLWSYIEDTTAPRAAFASLR